MTEVRLKSVQQSRESFLNIIRFAATLHLILLIVGHGLSGYHVRCDQVVDSLYPLPAGLHLLLQDFLLGLDLECLGIQLLSLLVQHLSLGLQLLALLVKLLVLLNKLF